MMNNRITDDGSMLPNTSALSTSVIVADFFLCAFQFYNIVIIYGT